MSYEPTNWKSGDVVTSTKLNKLEQGVADAGGVFVVGMTYDYDNSRITLDKTYAEILSAVQAGNVVIAKGADADNDYDLIEGVMSLGAFDGTYYATVYQGAETNVFSADSASGTLINDFGGGGGGGAH